MDASNGKTSAAAIDLVPEFVMMRVFDAPASLVGMRSPSGRDYWVAGSYLEVVAGERLAEHLGRMA